MKSKLNAVWEDAVIFYLGGMLYLALELLWRGWTHGSMFPLGGVCFLLIGHLDDWIPDLPQLPRAVLGAGIITTLELISGLYLNRHLALGVWDYSALPYNLWGQICPGFFFLWCFVAMAANPVELLARRLLFGTQRRLSSFL